MNYQAKGQTFSANPCTDGLSSNRTSTLDQARRVAVFILISSICGLVWNFFNPGGIALIGQWTIEKGSVTANPLDDTLFPDFEIRHPATAKKIFDAGNTLFVDARPEYYFRDGHIKGAYSMPTGAFDRRIMSFMENFRTDLPLLIYCSGRECNDSHGLANLLMEFGYTNVRIFIDGYPGWQAEGYPIELDSSY